MPPDPDSLSSALAAVRGPDGRTPLPEAATLSDPVIKDGRVMLSIAVPAAEAGRWESVRKAAETALRAEDGVTHATVVLTADREPPSSAPAPAAKAASSGGAQARSGATPVHPALGKVRWIIAVASGKGGVGKSTTACNLALAMAALGLKVGVLDADIYGPSMPKLFQLKGQPRILTGRTLAPLEGYGVKVMSIGFVVDVDKAMVWRGPMVASAITQMLRDVAWGELDVLVVDMPPGTGDAQLTLAQNTPLAGAVIVSTPQDLALIDARRGVAMFREVGVPLLGLVENMSYFVCDDCGKRHHIFGHGGARAEAERLGVPFLGEVPLDPEIRERSDAGLPVVVTDPDGPHALIYRDIASRILADLAPRSAPADSTGDER